jgi:RHS repeat-associated protein
LRWKTTVADTNHSAIVTVADGNGGSTEQEVEINVVGDTVAPKVRLIAGFNFINQGESVTFQARATDNIGVAGLQLLINDNPVVIDGNGLFTVENAVAGTLEGRAIATDAAGNTSEATFDVDVINENDTSAPTINFELEALPEDGFITAPTRIRATINDTEGLKNYRLLAAQIDGEEFKELWSQDNPANIDNQFLDEVDSKFKFDPSLLQNDSYILRLEATDNNNNTSFVDQVVDVAGELKLGNFRLSFTDVAVPVTGIPITLIRTYDTLTTGAKDDFGYGWRMEFRDTDLKTSILRDEFDKERENYGYYKGFKRGTKVYVTLPGGKREAFSFEPVLDPLTKDIPYSPESLLFYNPKFVAESGSTSTLTVKNAKIFRSTEAGGIFFNPVAKAYNPADPYYGGVYELTTKDGIVYEIDANTGDLLTATDLNGNTLTYTDEGIFSSSGQKITFERDAQGRIKSVKDPMNELIKYEYDDNGDLISVTDQEEYKTTFNYNVERPHYLEEIIDPLDRTVSRTEYDDSGRLKQVIGGSNEPITIDYDPENSLQTTYDALGNPTISEYDDRGNVIRIIDALGNETKMEYDSDSNVEKVTDANGLVTKYDYDDNRNVISRTEQNCGCPTETPGTSYYDYDRYGNLTSLVTPTGASMEMVYDGYGNMLSMKDGKGNLIQSFTYYDNGLVQSETDSTGTTTYEYNRLGYLIKSTDQDGEVTTMDYYADGNLKTMVEDNGTPDDTSDDETSTFTYDKLGREKRADYGDGIYVDYGYEGSGGDWTTLEAPTIGKIERKFTDDGKLAGWVTADGGTPSFYYDEAGRLFQETDASGNVTTEYGYDAAGRLTTTKDVRTGATSTKKYDAGGRVTEEIDPVGMFTKYFYNTNDGKLQQTQIGKYQLDADEKVILDTDNNPVVDTNVEIRTWNYEYNGTNTTVIDPIGRRTTSVADDYYLPTETIYQLRNGEIYSEKAEYLYDNNLQEAKDYPTKVIDIGNNERVFEYDDFGRLKTATDLADNIYTYSYGDDGLELITSPEGITRKYGYDEDGNLTSTTYEDNTITEMTYRETDNRLGTVELHSGETITYDYNDAGQITNQTSSTSGTVSFTYTQEGAVETMTDSTGTTTYRYDDSNRLEGIDYPDGNSISYEYDFVGRIKKVKEKTSPTSPGYVTEYDYDAFGNLSWIKDPNGGISTMKYDVVNRLKERELANGVKTTYEYDDLDRIKSIVHTNESGEVLASVAYERIGIGEPSKITREDGSYVELEYDSALRVEKESRYGADSTLIEEITYSYDADGRREVESSTVTGDSNYTYDGYQLDTIQNAGATENYDYDDNGRLTLIERDGETVDLEHDTYDRLTEVENQTTGETTQYIYGGGNSPFMRLDADGNAVYYLTDAMGTVIGLADGSGESAGTFIYDAFGEVLNGSGVAGDTGGDFRFQGQWLEEDSGLYHFRARDYDAETGLFLSRDAVDVVEMEPESFNPYQFVYNNPYVYSDPTGEITISELTSAQQVQKILQGIKTEISQRARQFLIDKAKGVAGDIATSVLKQLLPADEVFLGVDILTAYNEKVQAGRKFEEILEDKVCDVILGSYQRYTRSLWLEPRVGLNGKPLSDGFNCGENRPDEDFFKSINVLDARPDFIIKNGGPRSTDHARSRRFPKSYLVGDIKLTGKALARGIGQKQWKSIMEYARYQNNHQYTPVTLFMTFMAPKEGERKKVEREAWKKGVSTAIISIVPFVGKGQR